jgi:hypothetical protein
MTVKNLHNYTIQVRYFLWEHFITLCKVNIQISFTCEVIYCY